MKYKTLLLSCFIENSPQAIPLATSILKSYVSHIEAEVELLNFTLATAIDDAVEAVLSHEPQSIGCSVYIWNTDFFIELVKKLRFRDSSLVFYCGGPDVRRGSLLNNHFDYLIAGEGERAFRELLAKLCIGQSFSESFIQSEPLKDLNTIPSPFIEKTLIVSDYEGVVWELSRGCPFNCAFCCESRGVAGVRYFDLERVAEELTIFEENYVDQIFVLDPTFNINKKRALAIIDLIESIAPSIHFTIEIRADLLDEEMVQAFSRIHCSLQIGLQSVHNPVLKHLNRKIEPLDFQEKVSLLNQYGVGFGLDLIYGLPGDTIQGFEESLNYAIGLIPNHLDIFRLSVFPGTELFEKAKELSLEYSPKPPYNIENTDLMDRNQLAQIEKYTEVIDLFYNRGKSAPWLLPLLDELDLTASQFFYDFEKFYDRNNGESKDIEEIQIEYIQTKFRNDNSIEKLAVVLDTILFHQLFNKASNQKPIDTDSVELSNFDNQKYIKTENLQMGIFSYDVLLYYELGMFSFSEFLFQYEKEISYGCFMNIDGETQVLSIPMEFYQYIQSLDGSTDSKTILSQLGETSDELTEFVEYLIETGLIVPVV